MKIRHCGRLLLLASLVFLPACGTAIPASLVVELPNGSLTIGGLIPIPQLVNDDEDCRTLDDFFDDDCDDDCSLGDFLGGDDDCDE